MIGPALAILGGSVISGMMGSQAQANAQKQAQQARDRALQEYLNVNVPDPAEQRLVLERYQSTGQLEPQMEQAVNQRATELANMSVDPTGRQAEVQALQQMQNISQNGGMDTQAKQQEQEALNRANANAAGQRGAIVQDFAARGMGGSGAQLAAELQADQTDSNAGAAAGMASASGAEQRALQAMASSGQMGQQLNQQDYAQAAQRAQAQDAINKFNAQNQQGVMNANTQAINQAQAQNLSNSQNLANSNVDLSNKQESYNQGLLQQQYDNELKKAGGISGALTGSNGVATGYDNQGKSAADSWANIGSAVSQAAGAYGQKNKKDQSEQ